MTWVKGMARSATILSTADQLVLSGADLSLVCPELVASMQVLYARRALEADDFASIALENAKLSSAGSIRKAHDVLTWSGKLHNLRTHHSLQQS